uniref:Uncharacterized protein n=2 Tax=Mucochytrium quahogii TaxID=96639 RepID=A0A7S2REW9_9STRA|mmetsp:Transcript_14097/g.30505  ORF Transcript_14097/g.30505 Transcript_14097/m.30505 type:complete len:575 (+) Transcript_14097:298-2022(+)
MFLQTSLAQGLEKQKEAASKGQRNKKHGGLPTLKQCLSNRLSPVNVLGPDLIEHSILIAGLQPSVRLSEEFCADTPMLEKLAESLRSSPSEVMKRLVDLSVPAGFLVLEDLNKSSGGAETTDSVFYERFDPFILEQFKSSKHLSFANFNDAVDEFFSKIDIQRQEKADIAHKKSATKKINALKENQEQRIKDLQLEVVRKEHCAEAILANLENVDRAIQIVNSAIASGMSWDDLKELIAAEKSNGNEIAMMIDSLQLETGEMTVRLLKEQEEEDGRRIVLKAKVDLSKSAYKNVTDFFATKKSSQQKAERTIEHSKKVFDDAEKRFQKEIASHEAKRQAVRLQRKVNWFEKFRWQPRQIVHFKGKLVVLGDIAVGKTALIIRCQDNRFARDQKATVGVAFSQVNVALENAVVKFDVWDSAGEERFRSINSLYYHGSAAGIIVFDVTNRKSFDSAKSYWVPHLREHGVDGIIIALVGNKCDLIKARQVSHQEAADFAKEENIMYFESSAKTSKGVSQLFRGVASCVPKVVASKNAADGEQTVEGFRITKVEGDDRGRNRIRLDDPNIGDASKSCC